MFYHWRLESTKFGTLLNGLVSGVMSDGGDKYNHEEEEEDDNEEGVRVIGTPWPKKKIYDLLHVLLIGESAQSTAKFLKSFTASETLNGNGGNQMRGLQFTKSWDAIEVNELVKKLALCLQWDAAFLRQMLMEFAGNVLVSPSLVSETQNQIRNLFQMKRAHSGEMGSGLSVNGSSSGSKGMKHSVSSPSLLKHATSSSSSSSSSSSTLNPSYIAAPRFSHLRPSSSGSNLPLANTSAAAAAAAHSTTARNSITTTTTTASSSTSNSARTSVASTARNSTSSKPSSSSTYATPMSQKSEVELFNMASDLVLSLDILDMIMLAREQEEIKGLMNEIAQLQMEQGDDVEEEEHHHRSTDEEFIKRIDSGYTL